MLLTRLLRPLAFAAIAPVAIMAAAAVNGAAPAYTAPQVNSAPQATSPAYTAPQVNGASPLSWCGSTARHGDQQGCN